MSGKHLSIAALRKLLPVGKHFHAKYVGPGFPPTANWTLRQVMKQSAHQMVTRFAELADIREVYCSWKGVTATISVHERGHCVKLTQGDDKEHFLEILLAGQAVRGNPEGRAT